jgi:hypothetical protein
MLQKQPVTPVTKAHSLTRLVEKLDRVIALATASSSALTRWRLILFIVGAICTVALYKMGWYQAGNGALIAFVGLFLIVAGYHNRLESRVHRLRLWKQIKLVHLARLRLDWHHIPNRPSSAPEHHPYAKDLDLVGPHSLVHLLDTTVSSHGQARLVSWFLEQPPGPDQWLMRRRLVQELIPRSLFRDRHRVEARRSATEVNGQRLEAVLVMQSVPLDRISDSNPARRRHHRARVECAARWLPNYWMWSFAAHALLYFWTDQGEELLEHAVGVHFELEKLGPCLGLSNSTPGATRRSQACGHRCRTRRESAQLVRQAARTLHAISVKAHPVIHLIANTFCPWDLWFTLSAPTDSGSGDRHLPTWMDRLAEVEAASALATFAALHPSYQWPDPLTADPQRNGAQARLSAKDLAHPLISETHRVTNDLALEHWEPCSW